MVSVGDDGKVCGIDPGEGGMTRRRCFLPLAWTLTTVIIIFIKISAFGQHWQRSCVQACGQPAVHVRVDSWSDCPMDGFWVLSGPPSRAAGREPPGTTLAAGGTLGLSPSSWLCFQKPPRVT